MQIFKRVTLGLGALVLLGATVIAQAQTPPTTPGTTKQAKQGGARKNTALANMPISALSFAVGGLKDDQKTKIQGIENTLKTDVKGAAGDKTKIADLNAKAVADVQAILTPEQTSRFKSVQPTLTLLNASKAVPMSVLGDLKLTNDQMSKIKTAAEDTNAKIKAVPKADRKTKTPELRAEFKTKVDGILTAEQKTIIANAPKAKGKKSNTPKPPQ